MNRNQLEHLIRAASTIAADDELIVIGSQAILGQHRRGLVVAHARTVVPNGPQA